jgi:hypothetical protein
MLEACCSYFQGFFGTVDTRAKVVTTTSGRSQACEPGALLRSAYQLNDTFILNYTFPRPPQSTPCRSASGSRACERPGVVVTTLARVLPATDADS